MGYENQKCLLKERRHYLMYFSEHNYGPKHMVLHFRKLVCFHSQYPRCTANNFLIFLDVQNVTCFFLNYESTTHLQETWKILNKVPYACVHAQLSLTLCDPRDYNLTDSSVHEIFQARILEWVIVSFSWGSSQPRDQTHISCVSCIADMFFTTEPSGKPHKTYCFNHI